jgi:hypothetical protein
MQVATSQAIFPTQIGKGLITLGTKAFRISCILRLEDLSTLRALNIQLLSLAIPSLIQHRSKVSSILRVLPDLNQLS